MAIQLIHKATYLYRLVRPYAKNSLLKGREILYSQETNAEYLRTHIKAEQRFEHMIVGASQHYINRRHEIASKAYGA